ncbi:malto-oligosyltrehalose trehalohydrolase [Pengzhenrongella frigida]|uniref:Malto-oligosyltrehalose trehalohydrolase n=1 Tax=Pengzhenrongella frigida TaxID=1259133 RepID=A0A4Q5MXT3_9MICO|nr:malto-oligosyltrehalose trehalohydrolase [Cellulomonas sp. HLT2-17]RYV50416.1 malto-oligosyltrehalose trehalohydrolase [Cellulomonas sp. HLT2-17]
MTAFRPFVWAPDAVSVDLDLGPAPSGPTSAPVALVRGDGGRWHLPDDAPGLAHGTDYAFAVDGGPPRPDPRSAWQPAGVHAASRVFDTAAFAWPDTVWAGRDVRDSVIYELHVGTFTPAGTLDAAIERLDHLATLGIDLIELMPLAAFEGTHGWGYDGVDLYAVHEPYGGPAALQRFVAAAHVRGLAVCLDVVYNHLGPSGNYLDTFGPYFTETHHTPWGRAVNLDGPGADEVRRWICDNALRWLRDFHLDALRLDAVHALVDDSPRHLLAQLSDEVAELSRAVGRPLSLIAESDRNDPATVTPVASSGLGMTAQWADDVHHAIHALLTGERQGYFADTGTPAALTAALTRVFVPDGGWSGFRGKPWGAPVPADLDGHRFVVFGSDHDQVGNRALGDRPSDHLDAGALAASAALVLTSPYTPMIFMGEEWGARTPWLYFTDHSDPDLAEAVRVGRRAEFATHGWAELYPSVAIDGTLDVPDPQSPATLAASRLDWDEPARPASARLLDWYRELITLRRTVADLGSGDRRRTSVRWDTTAGWATPADASWIVVHRGDVRVVVNLSAEERRVPLELSGTGQVLANWGAAFLANGDAVLPGRSVAVVGHQGPPEQ